MTDNKYGEILIIEDDKDLQVFEGTSIKNLYVPEGSADAYREAEGWSLFEHIEEREF